MNMGPDNGGNDLHLTYCLNIHPGESWAENLAAIRTHVPAVRQILGATGPFGLGLRLGARAVGELALPGALDALKECLQDHGFYVFTVNAFPYGPFHGTPVKTRVYEPDWRSAERIRYTKAVAGILAALLPEGVSGSISTLPGAYAAAAPGEAAEREAAAGLIEAARTCAEIRARTGKSITIATEPEPDCMWDSTSHLVRLFTQLLPETAARTDRRGGRQEAEAWRDHLSVCFDTCHLSSRFESPVRSLNTLSQHGIPVGKIQVSAAPKAVANTAEARTELARFGDAVYLHQAAVRFPDGRIETFADLPEMIRAAEELPRECELRTHCHIPLTVRRIGPLESTVDELDDTFFAALRAGVCGHVEVETYTFSVLPENLRREGVDASVAAELAWVRDRLNASGASGPTLPRSADNR